MEENEKWAFFYVPLNEIGEKEMEFMDYIDNPSPNIKEFSFPYKYNRLLFHLYLKFNKAFNIIIDDCENERMKKENILKALEITNLFKETEKDEDTKKSTDRIIEILTFAKEHNSFVEFWF